ncbi:MAG: hypothetical protein U1E73_12735 [Planctomycetota bacterium]
MKDPGAKTPLAKTPLETDLSSPAAEMIAGGLILLPTLPLVAVFAIRLLWPGESPDSPGMTFVQFLIALAFPAFGLAMATSRRRILVDLAGRTVTWNRYVYGWRWSSQSWPTTDIEAVAWVERYGRRGGVSHSFFLVGPDGRRPFREITIDHADFAAAKVLAADLQVPFRDERPQAKPRRPETTARFWLGAAAAAVGMPLLFRFVFPGCGLGFPIGFVTFWLLVALLLRYFERHPQLTADETQRYVPSRFDFLGGIWLLSVPFGPLVGWIATEQLTAGNWQIVVGTRALLVVAVPAICVLPLLRCVRGKNAGLAGTVLLVGTAFPITTGLGSALDWLEGPVWQEVVVAGVRIPGESMRTYGHTDAIANEAVLADGRSLTVVSSAPVHPGPMRLLVLPNLGRVLDAEDR